MVWIALLLGLLIFLVKNVKKIKENDHADLIFLALGIVVLILVNAVGGVIHSGTIVYPNLISLKSKVESLYSEMNTIKNAYYESNQKGFLIAGSLDNYKQSTNLSQYIKQCAELKAKYNSSLKYYQTIKKIWIYKLFGYAIFISNRIYNLEEL